MNPMKTLAVIIPAYNEASVIGGVLKAIPKQIAGVKTIAVIVINDGSHDATAKVARQIAGVQVLSHRLNLGVGAAIMTGLEAAKKLHTDITVTLDGDGQHNPKEITRLIAPIVSNQADIVVGSRFLGKRTIPRHRAVVNRLASWLTNWIYQTKISDSQSGFRAYNKKAIISLKINVNGYEVCSELLGQAKRLGLRTKEVPITVLYSTYSIRKGQPISNSLALGLKLVFEKMRRI